MWKVSESASAQHKKHEWRNAQHIRTLVTSGKQATCDDSYGFSLGIVSYYGPIRVPCESCNDYQFIDSTRKSMTQEC